MRLAALAVPLLLAASPAVAQDRVDVSANGGVVSDYRFRGVSLSDRDPAVQGGFDLSMGPFFAGAWGSTIAEYGGAETELDLYAGLQGEVGGTVLSAGAYCYLYPGGEGVNYVELMARAERAFGPVTLGAEAALAPRQANVAETNRYLGLSSAVDAGSGWTLTARGGYEDGFYAGKWDWEVGAGYTFGPVTASLAWIDTDHGGAGEAGRLARGGVVGSLLAEF